MTIEHFDVIIMGAGLSGIGAGAHLTRDCPKHSFAILEGREAMESGADEIGWVGAELGDHRGGIGADDGMRMGSGCRQVSEQWSVLAGAGCVGAELRRAVDDACACRACSTAHRPRSFEQPGLGYLVGEHRDLGARSDHSTLELHGEHRGVRGSEELGDVEGHVEPETIPVTGETRR